MVFAPLIGMVLLTLPLLWLFVPEQKPGTISSLDGVTLSNINGQKFKLSGMMSGKKLLLVFWSITCGTCIEEIPFVIRLHEKLGGRLSVIGVHPPGYPLSKKDCRRHAISAAQSSPASMPTPSSRRSTVRTWR